VDLDAEDARSATAEADAKAEQRKAAKAVRAARPEPEGRLAPVRKPEPADDTVDLDAEARILAALDAGELDAEASILQLVKAGHKPSKAGVLAGRSDSYGRKVVRKARELTEAAPQGPEEQWQRNDGRGSPPGG
jgi:hypothetical protein